MAAAHVSITFADCAALPDPPLHTEWAREAGQARCTTGHRMHGGEKCSVRCVAGYAQSTVGQYDYSCQGGVLQPPTPECVRCTSGQTTSDGRHCLEPLCLDPAADNHHDGAAIELAGNNTACEYSCEGLAAFFGVELATTDCFIDSGVDKRWPPQAPPDLPGFVVDGTSNASLRGTYVGADVGALSGYPEVGNSDYQHLDPAIHQFRFCVLHACAHIVQTQPVSTFRPRAFWLQSERVCILRAAAPWPRGCTTVLVALRMVPVVHPVLALEPLEHRKWLLLLLLR